MPEPVDLIVCGQPTDTISLQCARLLEQVPAMLRPGGALICTLDQVLEPLESSRWGAPSPARRSELDTPSAGGGRRSCTDVAPIAGPCGVPS
jgi:hypothetical protein